MIYTVSKKNSNNNIMLLNNENIGEELLAQIISHVSK